MTNNKIETLRQVVANEALPLAERKDAAALIVRLLVGGVPVPKEGDVEVVELRKPWSDPFLAQLGAEVTGGRSLTGHSLKDAQVEVQKRHQLRVVLSVVVDDTAHPLERLAAVQSILDASHPDGVWKRNNYSAERLLEQVEVRSRIRPNGDFEYYRADPPQGARPPQSITDVWNV